MARPGFASVAEYVAAQPPAARLALERVRQAIRKALPGATESISYQIPVYKLDGRMVVYFAGFRDHYSLYPATAGVIGALKDELEGALRNKATIRFSYDEPVPLRLIARIAKVRAAEAAGLTLQAAAARRSGRTKATRTRAAGKKSAGKVAAGKKSAGKPAAKRRANGR